LANNASRAALLDRLALRDHQHIVGDIAHHRQVMADEDIGQVELVLQIGQQVQHLRLHRQVQRRDRLVQHQKRRVQHQRPRDGDPLALPAREHVRIAVEVFGLQPDLGQHRLGPVAALAPRAWRY
jgi:hypothetical protein